MAIKISGSTIIDDSRRLLNVGLSTFTGDVSIADKIVHTGDTDTAVRFPAANTFSVETAGSERLRVRSNGVVAIGTDESTTINFSAAQTQIFGTVGDRALSLMYTQANASGPQLNFAKGRDGDNSASTAVSSGDLLGSLHFAGADGSDFNSVGAEIVVKVDGTPGSNDMPGRIEFKTTADGASTTTERLRISADGTCSFSGNIDANGNLDVDGDTELDNLNVSGITTLAGNIFLGEGGNDQINVNGNFISGLDPLSHNLYDLGTNGKNWRDGNFAGIVTSTGLNISGIVTATTFVGALTGTASNASGATGDFSIADKIVHTGDTNTALRFPAADTFTVETSGNERIRVSAAGTVSIGSAGRTDWDNSTNVGCQFQIEGLTQPTSRMSITRNSNDAFDGGIILGKSRGTSDGSSTIVQDGDGLGFISFQGTDGTTMLEGAKIDAIVQSSVASDDMPTDLVFYTNNDTTTTAERLRITSTGKLEAYKGTSTTGKTSGSEAFTVGNGAGNHRFAVYPDGTTVIGGTGDIANNNIILQNDGKIGIGLTNPTGKLHTIGDVMIQGTGGVGEQTLFIGKSATVLPNSRGVAVAADQNSSADHDMVLKTSTGSSGLVERVRIKDDGNVGIGLTNPAHKLDVYLSGRLNQLGQGGYGLLVGPGSNTGGFTYMSTGDIEISTAQTTKDIVFSDAVGGNQRMRLTGDTGRLGIGTNNPGSKVDIASGDLELSNKGNSSALQTIQFSDGTQGRGKIQYAHNGDSMLFHTLSTEKLRITSAGLVGIGTTNPAQLLDVLGNAIVSGVVTATKFVGDGSELTGIAAGGGGGEFNTGITSTVQATPLSFETTMHTFPSTSGRQYVIESINVANVDESVGVGTTVNIIASIQDATAGEQTYIAYNVPIVTGGVIELLKNPIVAGPSDVIRMWTTNDAYVGVNNAADVYINYAEHESTDFISKFAATTTINSTDAVTLYTSTSNPTMIEKIGFANRTDTGDFPVSIKITSGTTTSYLAKNLIIPRYSTVDILDRPKRIETDAKIEVEVGSTSAIDVIIAGKKITS